MIRCDIIYLNIIHCDYVVRNEHTKANRNIPWDNYTADKLEHKNIDPIKMDNFNID